MDSAFFNSLGDMVKFVSSIALPASLIVLAVFIRWRTGSYLTIFSRLWTLFHGKSPAASQPIKEYLDAQIAVSQLRFQTGVKVRTEQHAKRLLEWGVLSDESLTDAAACGPYFDFEKPGLKDRAAQPGKIQMSFYATCFAFLITAFWLMMMLVAYDKPLLRIKHTGTWVAYTTESAEPFFGSGRLPLAHCAATGPAPAQNGVFSMSDRRVVCAIAAARTPKQLRADLDITLREQKASAFAAALLCLILIYPLVKTRIFIYNADSMRRRLNDRTTTTPAHNDAATAPTPIRQAS